MFTDFSSQMERIYYIEKDDSLSQEDMEISLHWLIAQSIFRHIKKTVNNIKASQTRILSKKQQKKPIANYCAITKWIPSMN